MTIFVMLINLVSCLNIHTQNTPRFVVAIPLLGDKIDKPSTAGALLFMKEIKLTMGKVALVDDEDFEWLNQYTWHTRKSGTYYYYYYCATSIDKKLYLMHRLIMGAVGRLVLIDHKDHNGLNNQRNNLRFANQSQNQANCKSRTNSSSKYLGVFWNTKARKWGSHIGKNGVITYLGLYKNEIDAALAYNKKATELHGEFANLNIIQP